MDFTTENMEIAESGAEDWTYARAVLCVSCMSSDRLGVRPGLLQQYDVELCPPSFSVFSVVHILEA